MPLQRRIPKRGFRRLQKNQKRREEFVVVNLKALSEFPEGAIVDPAAMAERGLVKAGFKVKVLGDGQLKTRLVIRAEAFSASARDKIAQAGGAAELSEQVASE